MGEGPETYLFDSSHPTTCKLVKGITFSFKLKKEKEKEKENPMQFPLDLTFTRKIN
jgi:hypothetical protein